MTRKHAQAAHPESVRCLDVLQLAQLHRLAADQAAQAGKRSDAEDQAQEEQPRVAALKQQGTSAEDAATLLVEEFKQQYPAWDQPGRVQAAVAAVYKELP